MSRFLSAVLLGAFVLTLLAAPADAQRRRRGGNDDENQFARQGRFALAFSSDYFEDGPLIGGIGGRYWFTDRIAGGASVGLGFDDYEGSDALTTSFSLGVERHFGREGRRVSPFVGVSGAVAHTDRDDEGYYYPTYPETPPDSGVVIDQGGFPDPSTYSASQTYLRGAVLLGAEVRLFEGVTASLSQMLAVTYQRSNDGPYYDYPYPTPCDACEPMPADVYDATSSRVRIGTGTPTFTLSIYF